MLGSLVRNSGRALRGAARAAARPASAPPASKAGSSPFMTAARGGGSPAAPPAPQGQGNAGHRRHFTQQSRGLRRSEKESEAGFEEGAEAGAREPSHPAVTALKWILGVPLLVGGSAGGYYTYFYSRDEVGDMIDKAREDGTMEVLLAPAESYLQARTQAEENWNYYANPTSSKLLPDLPGPPESHRYHRTLVLDLDETLVFSEWTRGKGWRTYKRPGAEQFIKHMSQFFEIVVFSKENNFYVDPIVEKLDPNHLISYRLYRHDTLWKDGEHRRDLSALNRDLSRVLYLSANEASYSLQPDNAIPVPAYKKQPGDTALLDLIPFLEAVYRNQPPDVREVMRSYQGCDIPTTFRERQLKVAATTRQPRRSAIFGGR